MASEEQEMKLKISQLAGQINRHKNSQPSDHQTRYAPLSSTTNTYGNYAQGWGPNRGRYAPRGYMRGGRPPAVHRNRSLVLNGNAPTSATPTENIPIAGDDTEGTSSSAPGWVAKTGRHLQLINTSIYEKDTQTRAKAMEETRKQKLKQRDEREKARLHKHIQLLGGGNSGIAGPATRPAANYEIDVHGVRFRVTKNGSKLAKVSDDHDTAKSTPKVAMVGGVRFHRTKNGNMYRSGIIKAYRRTEVTKKINEPCKAFSTTGTCSKGPRCRYNHDPLKVGVCKEYLQKGACPSGDSCDLSHELTPERTPACLHFARGNCSNRNCQYAHVRVSPSAPVCCAFGIYGYCSKGAKCEDRHVHECPDFSNTGKCAAKGCKLPHRHKASVMRINLEEEGSDVSSDDEDDDGEIGSDDVDSDDLTEEMFGDDGATTDSDVPMQRDFVQLS